MCNYAYPVTVSNSSLLRLEEAQLSIFIVILQKEKAFNPLPSDHGPYENVPLSCVSPVCLLTHVRRMHDTVQMHHLVLGTRERQR